MLTAKQIQNLVAKAFNRRSEVDPEIFYVLEYLAKHSEGADELETVYQQALLLDGKRLADYNKTDTLDLFSTLARNPHSSFDLLCKLIYGPHPRVAALANKAFVRTATQTQRVNAALKFVALNEAQTRSYYWVHGYIRRWPIEDLKMIADACVSRGYRESLVRMVTDTYAQVDIVDHILRMDLLSDRQSHLLAEANLPKWVAEELLDLRPQTLTVTKHFKWDDEYVVKSLLQNKSIANSLLNRWADKNPKRYYQLLQVHRPTNSVIYKLLDMMESVLTISGRLNFTQSAAFSEILRSANFKTIKASYRERVAKMLIDYPIDITKCFRQALDLILTRPEVEFPRLSADFKAALVNLLAANQLYRPLPKSLVVDCLKVANPRDLKELARRMSDTWYSRNYGPGVMNEEVCDILEYRLAGNEEVQCLKENLSQRLLLQ